jgi:hypothetical protein
MIATTNKMVIDWAIAKGIMANATPLDQICKTIEELGELSGAVCKGRKDDQVDAIGDVWVTLIIVNEMLKQPPLPMEFTRWDDDFENPKRWLAIVANSIGLLVDQVDSHCDGFSSAVDPSLILVCLKSLYSLSLALGHDMQNCLDHAYSVISKRKGEMKDGVFVKAAE